MTALNGLITADTNIVVYAFSLDSKAEAATAALQACDFLSVQTLNEYANVAARKNRVSWAEIAKDIMDLRGGIPRIAPIDAADNAKAIGIAERYRLSFYDALMLAVALSGGAQTIYSEDMQHGLVIDGTLRIVDPFLSEALRE